MPPEIIDAHAHLPPDASLAPSMMRAFRANGVGRVIISSLGRGAWPAFPDDRQVAAANDDTFAACERHGRFCAGYAYLNPQGQWKREIKRWTGHRRFAGVKLWISLKNAAGDPGACLPVLRYAADGGFPVLVHSFFRNGGQLPGELDPAELARLAGQVPAARIIMAHLGGAPEKGLAAVAARENVFVDTSGKPPARGEVEVALRLCGPERVLFGSDMPCRTVQSQLGRVLAAEITPEARALVLGGNARALFGEVLA